MNYNATIVLIDKETPFFCKEVMELIKNIDQLKSVHEAAKIVGVSSAKAWKMIRRVERALGEPAVRKQRIGADPYKIHISPACRGLLEKYAEFEAKSQEAVSNIYKQIF